MIARLLALGLFLIGLGGLVGRRNLIKKVYALAVMNTAVVILFILGGASIGGDAPFLGAGGESFVDPVPQALMLTAIVVGVCVSALALALAYRLYKAFGSLDCDDIKERIGHE